VAVVGAGIAGVASALCLRKIGVAVDVLEQRADPATLVINRPSVNLTLGARGLAVLDHLGLRERVVDMAVWASSRVIHTRSNAHEHRPYGLRGEAILSVRRHELLRLLLDAAQSTAGITIHFECSVRSATADGRLIRHGVVPPAPDMKDEYDLVIGADGLNSVIRSSVCGRAGRPDEGSRASGWRWIELASPPWKGSITDAVDVWPRDPVMLIAFPNHDGCKTVLLFVQANAPFPSYAELRRSAPELDISEADFQRSVAAQDEVRVVNCPAWHAGRLVVLGDAAHAVAPFLGQGANAALVDARTIADLYSASSSAEEAAAAFQRVRKPEMDCLSRLTDSHSRELTHNLGDYLSNLRRDLRILLSAYYPNRFEPIYNRVAFSEDSLVHAEQMHAKEEMTMDAVTDKILSLLGLPET